ncbi:MAG: hypothetical protein ACREOG_07175, partial [Gemmatimonadaceae bacterium]
TYTTRVTVQELLVPACDPAASPTFIQRYDATTPLLELTSWTRLIVRLASVDTLRAHIAGARVWMRQSDRLRAASIESESFALLAIDSLLQGPAELDVRSFAFNRVRDTVEVRRGYVDTVMVRLTAACK